MHRPQSEIITVAGQTIQVAESITYVYEESAAASSEWRFITLTQIKFVRIQGTLAETEKWETRTIVINPDHIVTVWPVDGWVTEKENHG
jgi:hypothetical protein